MRGERKIQLLIIADDLTGSNDAGAQFAKRGIRSIVLVHPHIKELPANFPVVVVNTESRHVPASEAAARVARVAKLGVGAGVQHFFKKTDSTLRGNIGAELEALLATTGENFIPFVPAFPELGRTTRGGIHYVHGIPIAETAFALDPLSPVRTSIVAEVLRATSNLTVSTGVNADDASDFKTASAVLDCDSRSELRSIAERCLQAGRMRVLSGSAAFAEELPEILPLPREKPEPIQLGGPVLIVSGSLNPRSLEQVSLVRSDCDTIWLTPEMLTATEPSTYLTDVGERVLLCSIAERGDFPSFRDRAEALGVAQSELHGVVADANGRFVSAMLKQRRFRTLIVLGGDTLMGVARAKGWNSFEPSGEFEPGVTVAEPSESDLLVVSKAGGFGDREVLRRLLAKIKLSRFGF